MTTYLTVSCDHVHKDYRLKKFVFKVHKDGDKFYARAIGWGCGRNADTPEEAVRSILISNACTNIKFHK